MWQRRLPVLFSPLFLPALVCVGMLLPGVLPAADEPPLPTPGELDRAFAWFDGLGLPSVKGCRFVVVATGNSVWNTDPPVKEFFPGFLLKEKGDEFVILTLGLEKMKYNKTPPGTPVLEQVYYEEADLRKFATAVLDSLGAGTFRGQDFGWADVRSALGRNGVVFALARQCAIQGHLDLAQRLYAMSLKEYNPAFKNIAAAREPREDRVKRDFEWFMRDRAFDAQGDTSLSRPEVLERFRLYVHNFPDSLPDECAKHMKLLEQMIKEDEEHVRKPTKPPEKMTREEGIAELIWRLRDQGGYKVSNPGTVDFFVERYLDWTGGPAPAEKCPASQLLDIGIDAVPQLVEAMTDTRFTRAADPDWGQHYRVGDCAWVILQEIAGRDFGWDQGKTVDDLDKETVTAAQAKVRRWLAEFRKKGEKQMLIEGTTAGDESSPFQARRLVEKYPDAALTALAAGARNSAGRTREELVGIAGELPGDGPVPFLLEEMNNGKDHVSRVTAAAALLKRGRPEAVPAMIALWEEEKRKESPSDLIGFLAFCGDPLGVHALGKDFGKLSVATRFSIISALGPGGGSVLFMTNGGEGPALPQEEGRKRATEASEQELLISALDDADVYFGCSGTWNDKGFSDPRICDMAGLVLSMRWPKRYVFDIEASEFERNVARVAVKNIWRKEHGETPLALPERPKLPQIAPEVATALFARLGAARTDAERRNAVAAIETHGLLALPPVLQYLERLEMGVQVRAALKDLARRLSCIVAEATFTEKSVKPDDGFRKSIEDLRAKPLTADAFMGVLYRVVGKLPPGTVGIRLEAVREDDGAGVRIHVTLLGPDHVSSGYPLGYHESVEIGGEYAGGGNGATDETFFHEEIVHEKFIAGIAKALEAPAKERFLISATLAQAKED